MRAELLHADGRTDGHTGVMNYESLFATMRKRLKTACREVNDAQKATSAEHRPCVMFALKYVSY